MRLDKYLKVARVLKRRTTSKQLALNDRLLKNDKIAKASTNVEVGDYITIIFGHRKLKIKVLAIMSHVKKEECDGMYEVIEEGVVSLDA